MIKNIIGKTILLALVLGAGQALAADKLETALAKASEQNKKVMVTLQGGRSLFGDYWGRQSDDFKNYANDNLVLLSLDRRKNRGKDTKLFVTLFKKYKISDFPTSLVLDAKGNELMRNIGPINSKTLELLKKLDDDSKDDDNKDDDGKDEKKEAK